MNNLLKFYTLISLQYYKQTNIKNNTNIKHEACSNLYYIRTLTILRPHLKGL